MVCRDNPTKIDDLGIPLFRKPPNKGMQTAKNIIEMDRNWAFYTAYLKQKKHGSWLVEDTGSPSTEKVLWCLKFKCDPSNVDIKWYQHIETTI